MGGRAGVAKPAIIADQQAPDGGFLPDLCQPRAVLAVVVGAQLLALLLALAQPLEVDRFWPRLGMWSLAAQWVGLLGTAGLCAARPGFARLPVALASGLAIAWLLLLATATTLVAAALGLLPAGAAALGWLLARNLLLTALVAGVVLRLIYLRHAARLRERAHHQARLEVLQARMRPHFLFNSLNTIASLVGSDAQRAEEVTLALADLLRASLQAGDKLIPLADELTLCRRYLAMEQLRLGERLQIDWCVGEVPPGARVPPLSLQPLLENAVFHGVEPLPGGGRIGIALHEPTRDVLEIVIDNPLAAAQADSGLHMALANLRARLAGHFGGAASLVGRTEDARHTVRLRVPSGPA
jgi:two-component system sensor histidine kinase AlgZ